LPGVEDAALPVPLLRPVREYPGELPLVAQVRAQQFVNAWEVLLPCHGDDRATVREYARAELAQLRVAVEKLSRIGSANDSTEMGSMGETPKIQGHGTTPQDARRPSPRRHLRIPPRSSPRVTRDQRSPH